MFHLEILYINELRLGETCEGFFRTFLFFPSILLLKKARVNDTRFAKANFYFVKAFFRNVSTFFGFLEEIQIFLQLFGKVVQLLGYLTICMSQTLYSEFTSPAGSAGCSPFRASTSLPACRWISSYLVAWPYRQMDSCLA